MSPHGWQAAKHWPVIHLRHPMYPRFARCGRLIAIPTLLTDDWGAFTCGACLIPYRRSIIDPRP